MIYWFTGQPGAGKTTLALNLMGAGSPSRTIHIDGDELRDVFQNKDYSEEGRRRNIERAQDIAHFLETKGYDVYVSLVSPYKDLRDSFKLRANVVEIYVHTSETRGRESFHVTNYEPPTDDFIEINTTNKTEGQSLDNLLDKLFPLKTIK
jgi:adenylylsulfate kinase-like enzyme